MAIHIRTTAVLITVLSLLGPTPVGADPECTGGLSLTEPAVLCGETTVLGDSPTVMQVDLSEPARLHALVEPTGGIHIEGDGRFVGVVLAADAPGRQGPLIFAGRRGPDFSGAVTTADHAIAQDENGGWNLPAGRYVLYLLADQSPVRITLRFDGLNGATTIEPSREAPLRIEEPEFNNYTAPLPSGYAAVDQAEVSQAALAARFLYVDPDPNMHLASVSGVCFWEGAPPQSAYERPLCPGALLENRGTPGPTQGDYRMSGVTAVLPPGVYGQGAYVQTASVPDPGSIRFLTMWLELV